MGVVIFKLSRDEETGAFFGSLNHRRRSLSVITLTMWQGTLILLQEVGGWGGGAERKVHVTLLIVSLCKC